MKFLHIADLHLGKIIYQQNLLPIQIELLDQVIEHMNMQEIEVLVMAGDIYDRSVPSSEAITALNDFLYTLIMKHKKKVLMISGNHDSSERLQFASGLLKEQGLHIVTYPEKEMKPIIIDDIHFYLVPFFKPSYIRYLYNDDTIHTYEEAFRVYLEHQNIDSSKNNVLITHQFVAGNQEPVTSESETMVSVGGSDMIGVDIFDEFDYVALGHLHASQKIKHEEVRYSGSLMKYSFDEVQQKKGMLEVVICDKKVSTTRIPLIPSKDLRKYQGTFTSFLNEEKIENRHDYLSLALEDTILIPHAMDRLRLRYPNILQITYPNIIQEASNQKTRADVNFESLSITALFQQFYQSINEQELEKELLTIMNTILEEENDVT